MYKRVVLIPYKMGSESCKKLAEELRKSFPALRVRPENYPRIQRATDLIIGWGTPGGIASNKLHFFQAASKITGLNIPEWTTDPSVAAKWDKTYLARTKLSSHSGEGIIVVEPGQQQPTAPLYVLYKKKTHEYRAHVFNGQVIDIVQKKRRADFENINSQIRNVQNGWVFCREDIKINNKNDLITQALLACNAARLDFGAVDIIYNAKEKKYYVLEVNTAPGLEGQTVTNYANAILNFIKG